MNRITSYLSALCAMIVLAVSAGCVAVVFAAGAAAGVSGSIWYHGELRTSLAGSLVQVRDAAKASLQKMGNGVSSSGDGALERTLTSHTGDSREITVELKSLSEQVTEIHVRVGFWGDRDLSQHILADIDGRLRGTVSVAPAVVAGSPS